MASSTAPRRVSDVLLTTLDHPGAGVARDGGGEQREYAYYVFQDSCIRAICKEPGVLCLWKAQDEKRTRGDPQSRSERQPQLQLTYCNLLIRCVFD